ncbi:MAG TPA: hypothetical protein VF092_25690 [Longimicrobium sp.]
MRPWMSLLAAAIAVLASASPSAAQTAIRPSVCTISCGCDRYGCYCSRTGGSGGSCKADASSCTVTLCATLRPDSGAVLALAADGSLVIVDTKLAAGAPRLATVRANRWRTLSRGHSVGVDCGGAVVAEYFDARTAALSRARSRRLAI